MSTALLRVQGLKAWYARAQILFDVSLEVGRGEVVALMGRNGAGKSTTFKAVMGLMERMEGEVVFHDQSLRGLEPFQIARLGLGYVPEERRIFSELTVMENLEVGRQPPRAGRARVDAGEAVSHLSQPGRDAGSFGWPHERRRAADADRGSHADGQSVPGAAG